MNPYTTILAALYRARPGQEWCMDDWRDEADMAQLTSAERGAAIAAAITDGFLVPLGRMRGDKFCTYSVATTHPAGKGRRVLLYARTSAPLPGQPTPERHHDHEPMPGQLALVEVT